ncbi:hypothetical protein OG203_02535 [Nocardia sp. NBC_01499]|uniref:hypothetical protein n=1 Tax=Nocardia sp. NBC_01499 TaxID=2903597 RepID=UPI0038640EBC
MEPTPGHSFARFVALGDSQTEGIGDPDGNGGYGGWADRFATQPAAWTRIACT